MKKIISILLIGMLFCGTAVAVEYMSTDSRKTMLVYVIPHTTGDTTDYLRTAISTSTIVPGTHRLIGYAIDSYNVTKPAEAWVGIYDGATDIDTTYLYAENEADATTVHKDFIYPYPVDINTGLVVRQGENTIITIFYDRR